ncbi:hypothetical protein HK100_004472 [Physocladia obscura]|uniref:Uncharacterized protein n=1 Tax=Physocladia obscura TaxID=109957 RepID=A0AAD5T823_9FUNG|nr:hypothetical protein HK100_004472 [Physocladia obscura]
MEPERQGLLWQHSPNIGRFEREEYGEKWWLKKVRLADEFLAGGVVVMALLEIQFQTSFADAAVVVATAITVFIATFFRLITRRRRWQRDLRTVVQISLGILFVLAVNAVVMLSFLSFLIVCASASLCVAESALLHADETLLPITIQAEHQNERSLQHQNLNGEQQQQQQQPYQQQQQQQQQQFQVQHMRNQSSQPIVAIANSPLPDPTLVFLLPDLFPSPPQAAAIPISTRNQNDLSKSANVNATESLGNLAFSTSAPNFSSSNFQSQQEADLTHASVLMPSSLCFFRDDSNSTAKISELKGNQLDVSFFDSSSSGSDSFRSQNRNLGSISSLISRTVADSNVENKAFSLLHSQNLLNAVYESWNSDWFNARNLLQVYPNSSFFARHAVHAAELEIIIQLASGRERDILNALKRIKYAESVCSRILEGSSEIEHAFESAVIENFLEPNSFLRNSLHAVFVFDVECCKADALVFKGVCQILMGREIKGTSTLRTATKIYQKLVKDIGKIDYPNNHDEVPQSQQDIINRETSKMRICVEFGIAFSEIIVELVPPAISSILKAIGLKSNSSQATIMLKRIAQSDSIRAPLSAFILLLHSVSFATPTGIFRLQKWSCDNADVSLLDNLFMGENVCDDIQDEISKLRAGLVFCKDIALTRWPCEWEVARKIFEAIWILDGSVDLPENIRAEASSLNQQNYSNASFSSSKKDATYSSSSLSSSSSSSLSLATVSSSKSSLFSSDWFELRPYAGVFLVACLRAEEGTNTRNNGATSLETAKFVHKELLGAVSSRKTRKTRTVDFLIKILEWLVSRPGGIHPLLVHMILVLRRDIHNSIWDGGKSKHLLFQMHKSMHDLTFLESESAGLEDGMGKMLTLFLQGTVMKCSLLAAVCEQVSQTTTTATSTKTGGYLGNEFYEIESLACESFWACLECAKAMKSTVFSATLFNVAWITMHAKFELAELKTLMQGSRIADAYIKMHGVQDTATAETLLQQRIVRWDSEKSRAVGTGEEILEESRIEQRNNLAQSLFKSLTKE